MDISNQINSILDGTERKEGYKLQGIVYQQKRIIKKENGKRKAEEKRKREWAKYGAKTVEEYLKAKQQLCGAKMQEDTEEQTKKQEGNPQLEDGFVKIANELVDVFCSHRLSGEEWQIIWSVFNKTYRWHRKDDWISLSQFVEMTGMQKSNISRALKKLLNKNIIIKSDNKYMFNKYYKEWVDTSKKKAFINTDKDIINTDKDNFKTQSQSIKTDEIINTDNIINTDKEIIKIDKTFIKNDNLALSKMIPTKDTITKDNITKEEKKENYIKERKEEKSLNLTNLKNLKNKNQEIPECPDWLNQESWEQYMQHRKVLKKPLTPQAIRLAFKKLEELQQQGDDPVEVINQSILNGWIGLFPLKDRKRYNKISTEADFERDRRIYGFLECDGWGNQKVNNIKRKLWLSVQKYPEDQREKILWKSVKKLGIGQKGKGGWNE